MDEKKLEEILKAYRDELDELYERRAKNAARRANMTEEELIADLAADYEAVAEDAKRQGVEILTVPSDDEEE